MEQAWSIFVGALAALWSWAGWKVTLAFVAGAWASDVARRRWPLGFGWVRAGFKLLGAKVRGMFKGAAQE